MNIRQTIFSAALASVLSLSTAPRVLSAGGCPYGYDHGTAAQPPARHLRERQLTATTVDAPARVVVDFEAVKKDIVARLTDSQDW